MSTPEDTTDYISSLYLGDTLVVSHKNRLLEGFLSTLNTTADLTISRQGTVQEDMLSYESLKQLRLSVNEYIDKLELKSKRNPSFTEVLNKGYLARRLIDLKIDFLYYISFEDLNKSTGLDSFIQESLVET